MSIEEHAEPRSELVTFIVTNVRPVGARQLFALVDVEVQIAGVAFTIHGVQARRIPEGGTKIELPTFKDIGGVRRSAISLPEEVRAPLANAVLEFLLDVGLARRKFTASA